MDERGGGVPQAVNNPNSKKRTIYTRFSRNPDNFLTLFDYPDPNITSEQRSNTNVPTQGLFFLNSDLVQREADALAARLGPDPANSDEEKTARIQKAYRQVFDRPASEAEVQRGLRFLKKADELYQVALAEPASAPQASSANAPARARRAAAVAVDGDEEAAPPPPSAPPTKMTPWQQYAQALLSAGEFYYVE